MSSLRKRLEAAARGERNETGAEAPVVLSEEMKQCVASLQGLVRRSLSSAPAQRLTPPAKDLPLIL